MLVQLNNRRIISLDAVSTIDVKGTKIVYTLNNNTVLTEMFDTIEEVAARLRELFDFNLVLDEPDYSRALQTSRNIQG